MGASYDVIVIGAGPAGEVASARTAEYGLTTVVVEAELAGGECSYWGCMPSKALLRPSEALHAAKRVRGAREAITGEVDAAKVLELRDAFVSHNDDKYQVQWIEDHGVTFMRGFARLDGERKVIVENEGSQTELEANKAVIVATGSSAAIPPIPGLRDIKVWDNRGVTQAAAIPNSLVVIGGGVIGAEMAQAMKRLGSETVVVYEAMDRLLANMEPFVGADVLAAFEDEGIEVHLGEAVAEVSREGDDGPVTVKTDSSETVADEILVATGRRASTGNLGLDTVGLEPGRFIDVDDTMTVTGADNDWLYAIGDVNGRNLFTHMGKYHAIWAADKIAGKTGPDHESWADHHAVPAVAFTDPQAGQVGLTAAAAREQGINVREVSYDTGGVAGASLHGEDAVGTSLLVIDDDRQVIVGATMTGHDVGEMLHAATIAVVSGIEVRKLIHAVPAFPTMSEVWLRLLEEHERQMRAEGRV